MMDVNFTVNALDLHTLLSTYNVTKEVTYAGVITTLDGKEHARGKRQRTIISFSLLPLTETQGMEIYNALLDTIFPVTFTDPYSTATQTATFRVADDLDSTFALMSVDGKRRYTGRTIRLRAV